MVGDNHPVDSNFVAAAIETVIEWQGAWSFPAKVVETCLENTLKVRGWRLVWMKWDMEKECSVHVEFFTGAVAFKRSAVVFSNAVVEEREDGRRFVASCGKPVVKLLQVGLDVSTVGVETEDAEDHSIDQAFQDSWWMSGAWRDVEVKVQSFFEKIG